MINYENMTLEKLKNQILYLEDNMYQTRCWEEREYWKNEAIKARKIYERRKKCIDQVKMK